MEQLSVHKLAKLLAALALASTSCAQAQVAKDQAVQAAVADGVTSAAIMMTGAVSVNPLLPVVMVGMKAATFEYTSRLPHHEQPAAYAAATAMWAGGAVNNACMTASLLTGGGFFPACLALGVAWGMKTWNEGERDRQQPGSCVVLREFMYDPGAACTEAPRLAAPAPARVTITAQDLTAP